MMLKNKTAVWSILFRRGTVYIQIFQKYFLLLNFFVQLVHQPNLTSTDTMKIFNGECFRKSQLRALKRIRAARRAERNVYEAGFKIIRKVLRMARRTGQASQEFRKKSRTSEQTLSVVMSKSVLSVKANVNCRILTTQDLVQSEREKMQQLVRGMSVVLASEDIATSIRCRDFGLAEEDLHSLIDSGIGTPLAHSTPARKRSASSDESDEKGGSKRPISEPDENGSSKRLKSEPAEDGSMKCP